MKKTVRLGVVSIILAAVMSLSVFAAATEDALRFLRDPMLSYEQTSTFTLKLNKPLTFLADYQRYTDENDTFGTSVVNPDYKLLSESLFNFRVDADSKVSVSPDMKKADIYAGFKVNLPAELYKNLKLTADIKANMWIRYDFTDAENPDMCVIYDYPIFRKYFYIDLKEALAATSEAPESNKLITDAVSGVEKIFDSEYINGLTDKIINLLYENANITKRITSVTVTLDNEGLANYVKGIADIYIDILKTVGGGVYDEETLAEFGDVASQISTFIETAGIFGKDGLTMKYPLGAGGSIASSETILDVDFNIYDLISKLVMPEGANEELLSYIIPEWLTRENSDVSFDVISTDTYTNVGGDVVIEYPELTEANSVSFVDKILAAPVPVPDDGDFGIDAPEASPFYDYHEYTPNYAIYNAVEQSISFGVREALVNVFGEDNLNITYDNGHVTAKILDGVPYKTIEFDIGKTVATVDGKTVEFINAPFVKNGVTYVSCDFFNAVLEDDCTSVAISWDSYGNYKQSIYVIIDTIIHNSIFPDFTEEAVG